ncbi:hypothetical protein ACW4YW_14995 [Methylobacillus pratensis]
MRRIDTPNSVPDLNGPGKTGFRDSNKTAGINATELAARLFNSWQEELAGIVEYTGAELDPEDNTQILTALLGIIGENIAPDASETVKGLVRLATAGEVKSLTGNSAVSAGGLKNIFSFTWGDVTASRAVNTIYTNSAQSFRFVSALVVAPASTTGYLMVNGLNVVRSGTSSSGALSTVIFCVIPPGATYQTSGFTSVTSWFEGNLT